MASDLLQTPNYAAIYGQVIAERGWQTGDSVVWRQMAEKGLDAESITKAILDIELEVWKRIKAMHGANSLQEPDERE